MIHYKFLHPQNEDEHNVLRSIHNESQDKVTMGDQVNFILGKPYPISSSDEQQNR